MKQRLEILVNGVRYSFDTLIDKICKMFHLKAFNVDKVEEQLIYNYNHNKIIIADTDKLIMDGENAMLCITEFKRISDNKECRFCISVCMESGNCNAKFTVTAYVVNWVTVKIPGEYAGDDIIFYKHHVTKETWDALSYIALPNPYDDNDIEVYHFIKTGKEK